MYIKCECTRELLEIELFDDEYIITLYADCFDAEQKKAYQVIWDRVRAAWFMLRGKQFRMFELCLSKDKFEDFKKEINTLGEKL